MVRARQQHAAMMVAQAATASSSLTANWQPIGPAQIASASFGLVTGRITAIALDPSDATGNTVYLGTTGGGVWKSTNAAGASSAVTFLPLTDILPVFSANAGTTAIPSLSIGAISVQSGSANNVVLAGTGDPNDNMDSYYGTGLLRSADGGATWTLIAGSHDGVAGNHSFVGLGVAGLAWSDTSPGLAVAALSDSLEGDLVRADDPRNSVRGLYYSTDAGVTWQMSVMMDGGQIVQQPLGPGANLGGNAATAVVWNPIRKRFYAAIRYHGYYESTDGAIWSRLAQQPGTGMALRACPTAPGTTGNPNCPVFRGALAVQPVSGDMFALTVDSKNIDQGLWQDVCASSGSGCSGAVSFGHQLGSTPLEKPDGTAAIPQADYHLALSAVASGLGTSTPDTLLFVGTSDLYRCSLRAGCSLRNTTNATNGCAAPAGVAEAQHAIATMTQASQTLVYVGNDGGLWRSTDGVNQQARPCSPDDASHFQNLNGGLGSLAEVVSFAQHPTDAGTLLVGLGANGSAGTSSAGPTASWEQLSAGEGGTVAIDPANPQNWYISTAAGVSVHVCGDGTSCTASSFTGVPTVGLPQVANDISVIDPPWLLDPAQSSDILIGTCRVWRGPAADGALWSSANAISPLLSGPQNTACGAGNPLLRSLAAGGPVSSATAAQDAGSTVLYAGMAGQLDGGEAAGGHLYSTQAGATAGSATVWTDLTNGSGNFNPDRFDISSLAADGHDSTGKTIYATIMGFKVAHLYRSTDAGLSWANISSNLPDAPANSVVIDPNDANTLYVATDTGVYVTQDVTRCTSRNCWDIYGVGLPNAPVTQLAVAGTMATGDGRTGELRAGTYGRGIWQIPLLSAGGSAQAAISLSPASLSFAAQTAGTASAAQSITVTNTGTAPLTVTSIVVGGDFNETDTCVATPIAVQASCVMRVVFLPTAVGARTGTLTIFGNVAGGQTTANLSGIGTAASTIVLNPINLPFPAMSVGATSIAENITISNTGGSTVTIGTPLLSGDFRISANTCGVTLAPGTGCTVAIVFTPTASGARSGTLTTTDSAGTQTASLQGTGTLAATDGLAPASLSFPGQQLGTTSAAQQVTLTNTGDVALTLIGTLTSGDFIATNACGNSLNGHSSCSIAVRYVPKTVGAQTGVLTVTDRYGSRAVALNGFGIAGPGVSLTPLLGLNFAPLGVRLVSAGQAVTLTNNSSVDLKISSVSILGNFIILPAGSTCGTSLAVNNACVLQIAFTPGGPAALSGSLTVQDSAVPSVQTVALAGTGVDFSLAAGNSTATIASGQSAVYPLLLTSQSGVPGTAVFTCSGVPAQATCLVVPGSVALGTGTVLAIVTVATGVATAARSGGSMIASIVLLLPFGVGVLGYRRKSLSVQSLAALVILCGMGTIVSCGTPRVIPIEKPGTSTNPVSPSGTSTIVVSASSAGLVRTVPLNLTIQ